MKSYKQTKRLFVMNLSKKISSLNIAFNDQMTRLQADFLNRFEWQAEDMVTMQLQIRFYSKLLAEITDPDNVRDVYAVLVDTGNRIERELLTETIGGSSLAGANLVSMAQMNFRRTVLRDVIPSLQREWIYLSDEKTQG